MAKSENQKLKTLYVAKYFLENSDENHPVTAGDITDYLQNECGIKSERRAIYRDIAALRDVFGMDIDGGRAGNTAYYPGNLNLTIYVYWRNVFMLQSLFPPPRQKSLFPR